MLISGAAISALPIAGQPAAATSAVAYSLSGAAGSYTYTGKAATFNVGHSLSGAAGSYAYTGQTATLAYTPGSGSIAYTLSGAAGSYAYTGKAATLTYTPGRVDYALSGAAGSYAYTGQVATFAYVNNGRSTEQYSGGYFPHQRRRTQRDLDEDRRRFGINIPEEVVEVIVEAASDQVEDLVVDPQKQKRDLQMRLRVRQLKFETEYLKALAIERERLIDEEIQSRVRQNHQNNQSLKLLLLAALH